MTVPFNLQSVCIKCGYYDVAIVLCARSILSDICAFEIEEHFHRICQQCNYKWVESITCGEGHE